MTAANQPAAGGGARLWSGLLLTTGAAVALELLSHTPWRVPNSPAVLQMTVVLAAFSGGRATGLLAAAVAWVYTAYFFALDLSPLRYAPDDARRVVVWLVILPATALLVGTLKRRLETALESGRRSEERLEVERRLRASEARFRAIAEAVPVGIFETDAEGRETFVNRYWCELTGRSADDSAGDGWLAAVHPDDRERIRSGWFGRPPGERAHEASYRLVSRAGEVRWIEGRAVEVRDATGALTGYLGALRDVTDVRRAEQLALREEAMLAAVGFAGEQLLRRPDWRSSLDDVLAALGEAAEVSRVYFFESRPGAGGEVFVSQRAEWAGEGIAPQIGNPELQEFPLVAGGFGRWLEAFAKGEPILGRVADFPAAERAVLEPQEIRSLVALPVAAHGAVRGFLGFDDCRRERAWSEVELDAVRSAVATLGAAIERESAEAELRASGARYRDLFDSSPVELWEEDFSAVRGLLDGVGFFAAADPERFLAENPEIVARALARVRVVDVNRQAVERLGAPDKAALLAGLDRVFTEKALEAFRRELVAIHRGETRLVLESLSRTFDGRTLDTVLHWAVQPGHERDLGRVLVSVLDVTEQRALRQQMERASRLETVGQLAGGVAHDFNNLLTVVLAASDHLANEVAGNERAAAEVEKIRSAANRAAALTRQLLAFGRRQHLTPQPVDLNRAIGELVPLVERVLPANIALRFDLGAAPAVVEIDPSQVELVLMNLVVNARDALPRGGTIAVATSWLPAPPAGAPGRAEPVRGAGVLLTVRDDGVGMDRQTLERCFEPFYSTKASGGGTGLGLATAYGVVRQSNGAIWAESAPGRGSSFYVFLPASPAPAPPPAGKQDEGRTDGGHERILLVEDEDSVRGMVARMLRTLGYEVRDTGSPNEALALVDGGSGFDLLLTDVMMPELSGDQLAERAVGRRPGLAVLFMSGYAQDLLGRPPEARRHFLAKPFTRAALARAVRAALAGG
jgi:PAS domain S-box-containing protein